MPFEVKDAAAWDVEATFKLVKSEVKLKGSLDRLSINVANDRLVPRMTLKYHISNTYGSQLSMPHTVNLVIKEKNMENMVKTYLKAEWLPLSLTSGNIRREENGPKRAEMMLMNQAYVLKDAFTCVNSMVGGIYEKTTVEKVIKELFNKTSHGKLKIKIGQLDNQKQYEQIWIPNMKFHEALNYIRKSFGMFENRTIIHCDLETLHVESINDNKEQDIRFIVRGVEDNSEDYNVDNRDYLVAEVPTMQNVMGQMISMLPKKIKHVMPQTDILFKKDEIDVISHLKKLSVIDNAEMFEKFIEDLGNKPETLIDTQNFEDLSLKETLSTLMSKNVKPFVTTIQEPFRLNQWTIGGKVFNKLQQTTRFSEKIKMYIDAWTLRLERQNQGRISGELDVVLKTGSLKNIHSDE